MEQMMWVSFPKKTDQLSHEWITVEIGIPKNGKLTPYVPISTLFKLVSWCSFSWHYVKNFDYETTGRISRSSFTRLYKTFVTKPENAKFIVREPISWIHRGGPKKITLNDDGLRKFSIENKDKFKFCNWSQKYFQRACVCRFELVENCQSNDRTPLWGDNYRPKEWF